MIAADTGVDLARLLLDLMIVIVAAKAMAELSERLRVPAVLGEIIAGVLIGPSVLGLIELDGARGVSLSMLAEIGVLLLLLQVGMEMDLRELGKVGTASLSVAVAGVALPFAAGTATGLAFGESTNTAIFIGAALTATSVGITARVFGDLRALATTEARIVLGAAVADDVLGLIILTVVVKVVTDGSVDVMTVVATFGLAILFLVVTGIVGILGVPKALDAIHRRASSPATITVAALAVTIAFAELADAAKLAFIIGAFMAGLGLGRSTHHERIARDLGAVGNVFIPVFFALIGVNADLDAMFKPSVLGLATALSVVAIIGKLASAVGTFGQRVDRLLVGLGMIPRGEVGLIFASIGLTNGVLNDDQYGGLILVVLVTTVITPPLLRWRLGRSAGESAPAGSTEEPLDGWLTITAGEIGLNGTPSAELTVPIALRTAALTAQARPSDALLDWFGSNRGVPLTWHADDTAALVRLLRIGEPRAFRFLDVSGVLERALPEVAAAMEHRRADLGDLDPTGALRFHVVERLDDLAVELGLSSDDLVLAGVVADVCEDADDEGSCALSLANRLVPDEEAQRITALIADARLLRAGAGRPEEFEESELLQLATHLASPAHARDAYELALALGPLPRHHREALDERLRLVTEALEHPELTGSEANNLAAARRVAAEHLLDDAPAPIERLRFASNSYLLSHEPDELARHARLIEPLPRVGSVRVAVAAGPGEREWTIDVACRDQPALLAHLTSVFIEFGLDIVSARIATWPDGGVVDTFVVASPKRPAARDLALAMEAALLSRLTFRPMDGLVLDVDNDSLPWQTSVLVSGADRSGVVQAVTAAFAMAEIVVHSARIATVDGAVQDRFAVTDRVGRKVTEERVEAVRAALARGGRARRGRIARR